MTARRLTALIAAALTVLSAAQYGRGQRRWVMYEHEMQNPVDDPPDAHEKTEFAFARLRFRSPRDYYRARWGTDANKSERQFIQGIRRLTRIHTRSIEEVVDIDSDQMYDWPFLYAVAIGDWRVSESQVSRLRNYFQRGGFLMVDDFHGEREWRDFMAGINRIFPNASVVELDDEAQIFHVVYNLKDRVQVPGLNVVHGPGYERGGVIPHWRAVVDEQGRVLVAVCFNMDIGDAWEWADYPEYPERYASLAYRIGINYLVYAFTH